MKYEAEMGVVVTIDVRTPDVIERVIGPGGDEWRSQFYRLESAKDVVEHFAYNAIHNGIYDVSRLHGWADCSPDDVGIRIESVNSILTQSLLAANSHPASSSPASQEPA